MRRQEKKRGNRNLLGRVTTSGHPTGMRSNPVPLAFRVELELTGKLRSESPRRAPVEPVHEKPGFQTFTRSCKPISQNKKTTIATTTTPIAIPCEHKESSMVSLEEVADDDCVNTSVKDSTGSLKPSEERWLDAEEILNAADGLKRPTARMQLEALGKRLQKESEALKRVENSNKAVEDQSSDTATSKASITSVVSPTLSSKPTAPPPVPSSAKYVPVDRFAFDAGGYNDAFVTLYVDLPTVGSIPRENIHCEFKSNSLDLVVRDLNGKSYRLFKDSLEKDIDPSKSKIIVKSEKIIVKMAKVKTSEYGGFDYWSKLTDVKKGTTKGKKDDPQSSIMGMMKQMYDDGDDNMKKMIGETMMKQQRGELDGNKADRFGLDDNMDKFWSSLSQSMQNEVGNYR